MPKKRKATQALNNDGDKEQAAESEPSVSVEVELEVHSSKKKKTVSSNDSESSKEGVKPVFRGESSTTSDGRKWNLKVSSWNVAGLKAWVKKDGANFVKNESPDIFVLEETKCSPDKIPAEIGKIKGYHSYFHAGDKEGYCGIGLLSKKEPMSVSFGLGVAEHDAEARLVTAEYEKFYVIGAYVPNSSRGLVRLPYRRKWNADFLKYISGLDAKKPVIYTGDLNVAHQETDLANPKSNRNKTAGFTDEEREDFTELLNAGFTDSFRHLYPDAVDTYSFWTYMGGARARNIGWRLDYFVLSNRLVKDLCDSVMHDEVMGSDHCPVSLYMSM